MDDRELFERFALALGVGLLIGVQRGWAGRELPEGARRAGLRTFGLAGLYGGGLLWLAREGFEAVAAGGLLAFGVLVAVAWAVGGEPQRDRGITSEVALLLTVLLGAIAVGGAPRLAAASAVVTALLLALKPRLHRWLANLSEAELDGALRLLLISVVVLPVLPDRGFGPFGALNPYRLWWMVVLIAGLGFAGYVAASRLGPRRGLVGTAVLGGLFASTAVALSFARFGREGLHPPRLLAAAILAAETVMFPRLLVLTGAVSPALALTLAPVLLAPLPVGAFCASWLLRGAGDAPEARPVSLHNPFELGPALRLAGLLAVILMLAKGALSAVGPRAVYAVASLAALTDVDAISLSLAHLAGGDLPADVARSGILLAAGVNTAVKAGLVAFVERGALAREVASGSLLLLVALGGAAWLFR